MFVRWYVKCGLDSKPIDTDAFKVLDLERCVGPTRSLALGMVMKMVGAAARGEKLPLRLAELAERYN